LSKKRTRFHKQGQAGSGLPLQIRSMTAKTFEDQSVLDRPEHRTLQLKKILVPIDFSPASKNAFKYAVRFGEEFGGELNLLYVLEPPPTTSYIAIPGATAFSEGDFGTAERSLRSLVVSVHNGKLKRLHWKVRAGVPSHEIVEVAKELDVDLIIIATHGYTGWKHFCIGSTAERVVRAAPCPVLVVREKEHEFC
jgi:nucleotide-binding universal stress UspA family protein